MPHDDAEADGEVDTTGHVGKVTDSESNAMMALSARIERKFRYVGKVFGKSSEK